MPDPDSIARYEGGYRGLPPVTPRNSGRSFWFAFMRGLGYGLARFCWRVVRGK